MSTLRAIWRALRSIPEYLYAVAAGVVAVAVLATSRRARQRSEVAAARLRSDLEAERARSEVLAGQSAAESAALEAHEETERDLDARVKEILAEDARELADRLNRGAP